MSIASTKNQVDLNVRINHHDWSIIVLLSFFIRKIRCLIRLCSFNDKSIAWRCSISCVKTRNRTPSKYVYYGLYLYFSGLSLRRVSERLSCFIRRNHVSIWNWVQKYHPKKISSRKKKIVEFIVDETLIKVGSEYI